MPVDVQEKELLQPLSPGHKQPLAGVCYEEPQLGAASAGSVGLHQGIDRCVAK